MTLRSLLFDQNANSNIKVVATVLCFVIGYHGLLNQCASPADGQGFGEIIRHYIILSLQTFKLVTIQLPPPVALCREVDTWQILFARTGVPILAFSIFAGKVSRWTLSQLRDHRIISAGGHVIVCGFSEVARRLVASEIKRGHRVVLVAEPGDTSAAQFAEGKAITFRPEASLGAKAMAALNLAQAAAVHVAPDNGVAAMDQALAVAEFVCARKTSAAPPVISAHVEDSRLIRQLSKALDRQGSLASIDIRLYSIPGLVTRKLMRDHPIHRFTSTAAQPHYLILGLGATGRELALALLRLARLSGGLSRCGGHWRTGLGRYGSQPCSGSARTGGASGPAAAPLRRLCVH